MSEAQTFIDACLAGAALLDDIDDWVDVWHEADGAPRGNPLELHDFLGLSRFEYQLWAERPSSLRTIVAARYQGRPIADMQSAASYALAARATSDKEALSLFAWLKQTGRIGSDEFPEVG
ncbi:hypothetical protein [Pseudonocardia sediminis]|uniref:hypothetical protein n=1 Tax=Pseudonocardia sediminis TaxID=1397368 RepID=UPI00102907FA|nr:hypothetical protein [Pseudonocardia sediminis]